MKKLFLIPVIFSALYLQAEPPEGYYRQPALHGSIIVFVAEGDLWTIGTDGGIARRLTSHAGEESNPAISPDGRTLAFAAGYEGPVELYTMPLAGGLPQRWTWEPQESSPVGWTPDGRLIYVTQEYATLPDPQLVTIDLSTGDRQRIPLTPAGDGVYDAAGRTIYFVRPAYHRNDTKRYKGGTARNIWKFSQGAAEAQNLTGDFAGEDHSPMWWKNRIYYVCDRDGTMNIWSMNEQGRDLKQHTRHSGWDVLSPSIHDGRIVYQLGADLWLLEIEAQRTRKITIRLASDFDQLREKWVQRPLDNLTSAHLHPKGESVVLTARGRVFVAPTVKGRFVQASQKQGVRYRDACFMPDGKSLLALSDESGELEFWTLPANGVGPGKAMTADGKILRFRGHPSADGKWVAYTDKHNDLWLLEVETGSQKKLSTNRQGVGDLAWSADGAWLAYSQTAPNTYAQIHIYHARDGRRAVLTSDRVNSGSAAWSPDGKFLYFLSDRSLRSVVGSPWGPRQPEPYFDSPMKIYQLALRKGLRSPFAPDDELYRPPAAAEKKPEGGTAAAVEIELDGIQARLREVPVGSGNFDNLTANGEALFWLETESGLNPKRHLMSVKVENKDTKPKRVMEDVRSYEMSADGKRLLVRKGNNLYVIDAVPRAPADLNERAVGLDSWTFSMDVREDFRQLFIDAWRLERDYFYDPNMHGVNWTGMRDKYLPLVSRVTTRAELNDLLGQLMGELSVLHMSVRGGDHRAGTDQVRIASLGARLGRDREAGGYRIEYIYRADPDYPDELSPLADPDLGIGEGDVILQINGVDTLSVPDPKVLLRNQQGKQVLLTVRAGTGGESRQTIVVPIADEANLRYRDWQYTRRTMVEELGAGEIGYVHLRAMGSGDLTTWYREFYPVYNRQGLIIDVRHNGGGNIDSILLSKLMRKAWFFWAPRVGEPYWNMQYAFRGHMVVICDERTASDGEAFAEGFRRLGLGKVIGLRTWGGQVWLSPNNPLTDGGIARAPQTGVYGPEREWLIEGHGVDPDIVVDNPPHATFRGEDAQLEAAVEYLKGEIRKKPVTVPPPPAYPDKSFKYPPNP